MNDENSNPPFYQPEKGLKFSCQAGCGACCKVPGRVDVTEADIKNMANHFGMKEKKFISIFLKKSKDGAVLEERDDNSCIMLGKTGACNVYPVRPIQCRTYPFWDEILANDFTWLLEKKFCPGIDTGRHYSIEEIRAIRDGNADASNQ